MEFPTVGGPALKVAGGGVLNVRESLANAAASALERAADTCGPGAEVVVTVVTGTLLVGAVETATLGLGLLGAVVVPLPSSLGGIDLLFLQRISFFLSTGGVPFRCFERASFGLS